MLFTSFQYLLFLPTVVLLYWVLPKPLRLPMLLLSSYFFYMSWMPVFILLIVPMTLFNWLWGRVINADQKNQQNLKTKKQKWLLGAGIAVNLLILGAFKYAHFVADQLAAVVHLVTRHDAGFAVNIILPLGISFFTFEFIHYLFEIYRGQQPIKSFVLFALFAAFFPTQIAGPIKRYPDFQAQMLAFPKLRLSYFDEGVPLIIIGLAKKLLLADNLASVVQMFLVEPTAYGAVETWVCAYAFAFQIYFDFSGYTDIARGSAMLFGYHIPINFNMPYIAQNVSDFWRRWHISLSTWLRDYLFIPLGGSRESEWKTNRNLFITMALGGLWHGAAWNFVIWGVFHGLCLIVHRRFSLWKENAANLKAVFESRLFNLASIFLTFHVVCIGWVFFRVQDIKVATAMIKKMVLLQPIYAASEAHQFVLLKPSLPIVIPVVLIMIAALLILNLPISRLNEIKWFQRMPAPLKAAYCSLLILAMVTFLPDDTKPFIYFQF